MKSQVMLQLLICTLMFSGISYSQVLKSNDALQKSTVMKTYVIERNIPNAGQLTDLELKAISQKSCSVIDEMGTKILWLHSYVTENKIYCIYKAESKEAIEAHGSKGGFPVNSISELTTIINPDTAKE